MLRHPNSVSVTSPGHLLYRARAPCKSEISQQHNGRLDSMISEGMIKFCLGYWFSAASREPERQQSLTNGPPSVLSSLEVSLGHARRETGTVPPNCGLEADIASRPGF